MGEMLHTVEERKLDSEERLGDGLLENKPLTQASPPRDAVAEYIEEIHSRAETISPLLQKLLDMRPPPRWGINE